MDSLRSLLNSALFAKWLFLIPLLAFFVLAARTPEPFALMFVWAFWLWGLGWVAFMVFAFVKNARAVKSKSSAPPG